MAAGSVIGAMAGVQYARPDVRLPRRCRSPSCCFVIGGLALSGVPPFSGFFSKDEILAVVGARGGGWHWVLYVVGYVGAFLTAIYTFRMIFRAFCGEPCPEARELEDGHLHHAERRQPATGEIEDTDVGFPGPEHHIAERERADEGRDGRAGGAGDRRRAACRSRGSTTSSTTSSSRRSRTRRLHARARADGAHRLRPACSAPCSALAGIGIAYRLWVVQPGDAARASASASRACTGSSSTSGTSTS